MANAVTWTKRVAAWRASGLTAPRFCEGRDFAVGTLRWWASRLGRGHVPGSAADAVFPLARVVRRRDTGRVRGAGAGVVIELGGMRVAVDEGFDRASLHAVLDVLAERSARGER